MMQKRFAGIHALIVRMIVLAALAAPFAGCSKPAPDEQLSFDDAVSALEQEAGGAIGVYAIDTGSGRELGHRADERFAMASTFKPLLVAAILADVDAGTRTLEETVGLDGIEVQTHSPAIEKLGDGERISVADLCEAAITVSDNTATNMLLALIGGPPALTRFIREHGDDVTRLDRSEVALNSNVRGDERDTTTPRAMAGSLQKVLFTGILGEAAREQLQSWLVASTTGKTRLRAGLPADWRVGDKTGTGMNGAVNDVAVAWPPGRPPIVITVYMSWSDKDVETLSAVHARIAALVAAYLH
jgi:beta-lactamase class A